MASKIKENILETNHVLEQQKLEKQVLQQHIQDMNANVSFTYTAQERRRELCPTDHWTTNCTVCKTTCCENCTIDSWKYFCDCINFWGNCKKCECASRKHKNQQYTYRTSIVDVLKSDEDLKRKYMDDRRQKASSAEEMIMRCEAEIRKKKEESIAAIKKGFACSKKLKDIALRYVGISARDYLDELIKIEENTRTEGAEKRVRELKELKENYDILAVIEKGDQATEESLYQEASDKVGKKTESGAKKNVGFLRKFWPFSDRSHVN